MNYPSCVLSKFASIYSGFAFKSKDLVETGIPVIKIANIQNKRVLKECESYLPDTLYTNKLDKYMLKIDDVLIAMTGAGSVGKVGKMHNVDRRYLVNQRVAIVRPDSSKCVPEFIYQVLSLDYYEKKLYNLGLGAGQPNISAEMIGSLNIPHPDMRAQHKIAAILSAYDALLENNTRRIKILEEMAQTIYDEWFVKFKFPGHENVKMVDSELGMIPESWNIGRLDEVLVLQRGFDLPTNKRKEGQIPIYASTGIVGMHNEAKVNHPSVVTGRSGSIGTVMYVDEKFWPLNTALWVKEFRKATPVYAFYLLKSINLNDFSSGAAVPTLNRNHIHSLNVIIPPNEKIELFTDYVSPILKFKNKISEVNTNLRTTRDLLLPRLISGEIDVSELDINVGEVTA